MFTDLHQSRKMAYFEKAITFEQYEKQNDYGHKITQPTINENNRQEHQKPDALAELQLVASINELRISSNKKRIGMKELHKNHAKTDDVNIEEEITMMLRQDGPRSGCENVKWSKAMRVDKIPVVGMKNTFITDDFFKFDTPK